MPTEPLRLLCILAHPDDESLGTGGLLAKYAALGIETYLITATRGEHGWLGDESEYPGVEALGKIREAELHAAAEVLGIKEVIFLDYIDGYLDTARHAEVLNKIVHHIRRIRPQVVVTFDPTGVYGHPDHIAISQFANSALVLANNVTYTESDLAPHQVGKLYFFITTREELKVYEEVFGELVMHIDEVERRGDGWAEWVITTILDTSAHTDTIWQAIDCHTSQLPAYENLRGVAMQKLNKIWSRATLYRAYSLVNSGREIEDDLFAGLR